MANHQENHQGNKQSKNKSNSDQMAIKKTPMIVDRVYSIPVINFAISVGFSQYNNLKSSNVTVGDVMTKAEGWVAYVWNKVQPIVEKFQEPINKADKLACNTLDFVEDKIHQVSNHLNHQQTSK